MFVRLVAADIVNRWSTQMQLKRIVTASTLAAGIGVAGIFGVGLAGANADPGRPDAPSDAHSGMHVDGRDVDWHDGHDDHGGNWHDNRGEWHDDRGHDWHDRGIDDGRRDHHPFDWNGQMVNPMFDPGHNAWGFWVGPIWIPL